MQPISEILLEKSKSNTLAHFYILRAPQNEKDQDSFLQEWIDKFLIEFIGHQKKCSPEIAQKTYQFDVPDLLTLRKQSDRKQYLVEDLATLFNFVELRPFEFKTKIAIVTQAHLIEKKISNKLLKLLEEPTENTTIFFLYGSQNKALNTIESRGINIQLLGNPPAFSNSVHSAAQLLESLEQTKVVQRFESFLQSKLSLSEILDFIYKKKENEQDLIVLMTTVFQRVPKNFQSSSNFLEQLKIYEKSKLLNLPLKTRIFPLLQITKKHFSF